MDMVGHRGPEEKNQIPEDDEVDEEYDWLRAMYEENDMDKRRFMARMLFEM